ncbi:unnamed protein product, partial [Effrenium voratum]
ELRAELPLVRHYKDQVSAAFVALFRGDELFLVKGSRSGLWQLPGGMIEEADANVWEAATREFFEERPDPKRRSRPPGCRAGSRPPSICRTASSKE